MQEPSWNSVNARADPKFGHYKKTDHYTIRPNGDRIPVSMKRGALRVDRSYNLTASFPRIGAIAPSPILQSS